MNFLQYVLQQKESSLLYKMLRAQEQHPVKGDWLSDVVRSLEQMGIQFNLEEIRKMRRSDFRKITKNACEIKAFFELRQRQENGNKGRNLLYEDKFQMPDYLCPNDQCSVEDQRILFQIRSRTNPIPARGSPHLCSTGCGEFFENSHVLTCEVLKQESKFDLNSLINGSLNEMRTCLKQWKENLKNIEAIDSMDSLVQC